MIGQLTYDNIRWECDKVKVDEDNNDQVTSTKPVPPAAKQELIW